MTVEEHYRALELDPNATPEQVEAAYLDLINVWLPDRFPDPRLKAKAEEKTRLVSEAYRHLKEAREAAERAARAAAAKPSEPVARPAAPRIAVKADPEAAFEEVARSPWELHGWTYSIVAHTILLLIMGLWFFGAKPSQVRTFDTRLAGEENGVEDGLTNLGGFETPLAMPELAPAAPTPESTLTRLQQEDASPVPVVAGQANNGNPGIGSGEGFGLARFGNGGEEVRGVQVRVGDPQFTLIWDSKADIDLHVVEPGGKEIYWNDRKGRHGGELDVDNVEGFGPENIYWMKQNEDGSKDLGPGPPGEYRWWVLYYGGNGGVPAPTRWKVRIKHEGRVEVIQGRFTVPGARSKNYTLTVGAPTAASGTMPDFKP